MEGMQWTLKGSGGPLDGFNYAASGGFSTMWSRVVQGQRHIQFLLAEVDLN